MLSPSIADNPEMVRLFGKFERLSASSGSIRGFMQLIGAIDVGPILPTIRTLTLVLHRKTDVIIPIHSVANMPNAFQARNSSNIRPAIMRPGSATSTL